MEHAQLARTRFTGPLFPTGGGGGGTKLTRMLYGSNYYSKPTAQTDKRTGPDQTAGIRGKTAGIRGWTTGGPDQTAGIRGWTTGGPDQTERIRGQTARCMNKLKKEEL